MAEEDEIEKAAICVNNELEEIISKHIQPEDDILVVGLGNLAVTPDSLRSKSCTRYRHNEAFIKICSRIFRRKCKTCKCYSARGTRYNRN